MLLRVWGISTINMVASGKKLMKYLIGKSKKIQQIFTKYTVI